jgi:hypothetical protein
MKHCLSDMELSNNAAIAGNAVNAENGESRGVTENVVASFKEARNVNSSVPAIRPFPARSFPAISAITAITAF